MDIQKIREVIAGLVKDATTAGINTTTGLNFYFLEPTAKSIYPVFYPLLASVPRVVPTFNGVTVGGTAVNWKAITGIDSGGYPAVSEGNRNAYMNITEKNFSAPYKFLGKDIEVSFQAQQTGLGFDDTIGIAQVSVLNALLIQEEEMILFGNSGSAVNGGANGFQLGQCGTPTVAGAATGGSLATAANYYVKCIALTGWGVAMASATGCALPTARTNANGSQDIINGGTSQISGASSGAAVTSATSVGSVTAYVTAIPGALGYAWYIGQANTAGSMYFWGVSSSPGSAANPVVITKYTNTNQPDNASNATGSFATDNSANILDFDGIVTWAANFSAATPSASYVKDLGGANLTSNGDGSIAEFEAVMDYQWLNFKITPDKIWLGGTLMDPVSKKILGGGVSNAVTRVFLEQDKAGKVVGGTFAVAYRSKFGPGQTKQLDVMTHPYLPQGTVLFDLVNNPYPAAGNSIPAVRRIMTLEDHFSVKWPYRSLVHEVGVYCFETLEHYIPFGISLITGAGNG